MNQFAAGQKIRVPSEFFELFGPVEMSFCEIIGQSDDECYRVRRLSDQEVLEAVHIDFLFEAFATHPHKFVAACMLAALETKTHVDATETAVLKFMVSEGVIKPDAPAHVEYGCLEHGVVHVNAWDDNNKDRWFGLDPAADQIEAL